MLKTKQSVDFSSKKSPLKNLQEQYFLYPIVKNKKQEKFHKRNKQQSFYDINNLT